MRIFSTQFELGVHAKRSRYWMKDAPATLAVTGAVYSIRAREQGQLCANEL
jgi:hypothetical protein